MKIKIKMTGFVLLLLMGLVAHAGAATRTVNPGVACAAAGPTYCTIQQAVDAATSGDTISIAAGTYTENVSITDKSLGFFGAGADTTTVTAAIPSPIFTFFGTSPITASVSGLKLTGTSSASYGGGIYAYGTNLTVENCEIVNNTSKRGSGIYASGVTRHTLIIRNSSIHDNHSNFDVSSRGGGVYVYNGDVTLEDSQMYGNTAVTDYCAMAIITGNLHIERTSITGNNSVDYCGIYHSDGTAYLEDSVLEGNDANNYMAGYFHQGSGDVEFNSSQVVNNSAFNIAGIFIIGDGSNSLSLVDSEVSANDGDESVGGVSVQNASGTLLRSHVSNNLSTASFAGYYIFGGAVVVVDSGIDANTGDTGSGLYFGLGDGLIITSSVSLNESASDFAGLSMAMLGTDQLTAINSTFSDNLADGRGAGVSIGGVSSFYNVTVADNTANATGGNEGAGLYVNLGSAQIKNSLIAGNISGGNPADCVETVASSVTSLGYNLIQNVGACVINDLGGATDLNEDPLLEPLALNGATTFSRALSPDSPALDAGNPAGCTDSMDSAILVDQRGVTRDDDCDIGAFEYVENTATATSTASATTTETASSTATDTAPEDVTETDLGTDTDEAEAGDEDGTVSGDDDSDTESEDATDAGIEENSVSGDGSVLIPSGASGCSLRF